MKQGYLSRYFDGVAAKRLTPVEVDARTSNQHEFNGVKGLHSILGEPGGRKQYKAKFLYFSDRTDDPVVEDGFLTWYDARERAREERGVMRYEYRLYFSSSTVSEYAKASDLLVIAKCPDDTLFVIIAENETTIERQIMWLFGFSAPTHPDFSVRKELETERDKIGFASRCILENIGVVIEETEESRLDEMLDKFEGGFPTTREFSSYARSTLPDINLQDGYDDVLIAWMDCEERLFKTLEKHLVGKRLSQGFDNDVDGFISFSLSVHNRRKSRAGQALENHLESLFQECGIRFSRNPVTENNSRPDFIFPGKEEYHTPDFDCLNLTMLGVKSTCKDRWRQVLSEAARIETKHLLTLEAAISENQTDEMQAKSLQLVLPKDLHDTYSDEQQKWLMDVVSFTELVIERQNKSGI